VHDGAGSITRLDSSRK